MSNPNAIYNLKGCEIKERQLFVRTYYSPALQGKRELSTATYFIDGGRAYSVDKETGEASRCNFNASFLNTGHTKAIQPLEEFYESAICSKQEGKDE